jgi:hypothetical protein
MGGTHSRGIKFNPAEWRVLEQRPLCQVVEQAGQTAQFYSIECQSPSELYVERELLDIRRARATEHTVEVLGYSCSHGLGCTNNPRLLVFTEHLPRLLSEDCTLTEAQALQVFGTMLRGYGMLLQMLNVPFRVTR